MTTCFVIGPIGNRFAGPDDPSRLVYEDSLQVFEDVITAACSHIGIDPVRADQIAVAGEITEQVFRHIFEDDIVIADVSGGNPNVMYELGLRHTTGKLTIQIGEFKQLPFDVNTIRTIQFSRSPRGIIDARKDLERALQAGMLDGQDMLTATRVLQEVNGTSRMENLPTTVPEADEDEDDAPGILDTVADLEVQMELMSQDALGVAETIEAIGIVTESAGAEIERAAQSGASNSARLAVVAKFAAEINEPVEKLDKYSSSFASRMKTINSNVHAMLNLIEGSEPDSRPEGYEEFLDQLISVAASSREGMEGLNSFGTAAEGLGSISRQLRGPGKKIKNAVENMRTAAATIDSWERAARKLKDPS